MSNNADESQKFGEKVTIFTDNVLSDSQETVFYNNYYCLSDVRFHNSSLQWNSIDSNKSNNNLTVNLHSQEIAKW